MRVKKSWSLVTIAVFLSGVAEAAPPKAPSLAEGLRPKPVQKEVEFDVPSEEEAAKCSLKPEKFGKNAGWVLRDAQQQILRIFVDASGDSKVDQWCYFKEGVEVYRDIDANGNGKIDQCRWLNLAGTRWGIDRNEDGVIDYWKAISAEEVTAEAVAALRDRDPARFERLLLSKDELKSLGLGAGKAEELEKKLAAAPRTFRDLATKNEGVTDGTRWVYFGGGRPGVVPAGTQQATADLWVYENVAAMVETGGKHGQVPIGTLVRVQDAWRLIDSPQGMTETEGDADLAGGFFIPQGAKNNRPEQGVAGAPNEASQKIYKELQDVELALSKATTPEEQEKLNAQRADALLQLAESAENPQDRTSWLKQFADVVGAAVQGGGFAEGTARLRSLQETLEKNPADAELAAYVHFRFLTAEYTQSLQQPDARYEDIQAKWKKDLEQFAADYLQSADAADAMLQLGIAEEFAGNEDKALAWYEQIVSRFPKSPFFAKAQGAKIRLDSVGKSIPLQGKSLDGKSTIDLTQFRGKAVLIQYWASWAEPSKNDLPILKDIHDRYGRKGFEIIGVNLDNDLQEVRAFLADNPLRWPQIFEGGGLESPLATQMGVLTLPTMLLVDKQGKVINRSVHANQLDKELKDLLK